MARSRRARNGGRHRVALGLVTAVFVLGLPAAAAAAPPATRAYYISGASAGAVEQNAYNDACAYARSKPPRGSLLMLDFGAARVSGRTYGTIDFSNNHFTSNSTILSALKSASNAVHNCYGTDTGTIAIAYGASNYRMTESGMTTASATAWGQWQATRANQLAAYETANHRLAQSTAVGVDIEPAYDRRAISNQLVNGVAKTGGEIDYDYGSADGCPTGSSSGECYCNAYSGSTCTSAWSVNDVAYASFGASALPLPEIYLSPQQKQWAEIQQNWDNHHGSRYFFAGVTAESGAPYSPSSAFNALTAVAKPGTVISTPGIICFGC